MFAYCNNTPATGCDPCGTCFHRIDFWNDCEECGGKTYADKASEYTEKLISAYEELSRIQNDISTAKLERAKKVHVALVDNYLHSLEIENHVRTQQAQMVTDFVYDRFSTIEKTNNTLDIMSGTLTVAAGYAGGVCAGLAIPTLGMSVPTAGAVAMVCGISAGVIQLVKGILNACRE